jgi:hypothetical protein
VCSLSYVRIVSPSWLRPTPPSIIPSLVCHFPHLTKAANVVGQTAKAYADILISWANFLNIVLDPSIGQILFTGLVDNLYGGDRFDAIAGLYGMINVILGNHPTVEPLHPRFTTVEGWIFGQEGLKMGFYGSRSI